MRIILGLSLLLKASLLLGQGPISGFLPGKKHTDFAINYGFESYDTYKFGGEARAADVDTKSWSLYIERGVSDSSSLVFTVPYMMIDAENKGIQDAILAFKFRNSYKQKERMQRSLLTSVGISTPLSAYPIETENPIGIRATVFQGRFLGQYQWWSGVFFHLQSGFDFRIIPDAQTSIPVVARIGWAGRHLYLEAWSEWQHAFKAGVDQQIGAGSGSDWWRIGGTIYYPISPSFGVFVGGAQFIRGRNIGLASRLNFGMVYKAGNG